MCLKRIIALQAILLVVYSLSLFSQEEPWENIGPFMGYINDMCFDENHQDSLFAGTPYGVYRSLDGAMNWTRTGLSGVEINRIISCPGDPLVVAACSDSIIYKSTDLGESWTPIYENKEYTIGAIAFEPGNPEGIWVGINAGIMDYTVVLHRTGNGGIDWEPVPFSTTSELKLDNVDQIHFDQSNPEVIYACGYNVTGSYGLFVSQDGGSTWAKHNPGGCSINSVLAVATTPEGYEPHETLILVDACKTYKQLFKSMDYGDTWQELGMWTYGGDGFTLEMDYLDRNARVFQFDPDDPRWLLCGAHNSDKNTSLLAYNIEEEGWYYYPYCPHSDPTSLLTTKDGIWYMGFEEDGVFYCGAEDTTWVQRNRGMNAVEVHSIVSYPGEMDKVLVSIEGSMALTHDGGENWTGLDRDFPVLCLNPRDTNTIFMGEPSESLPMGSPFYVYEGHYCGSTYSRHELFSRWDAFDDYLIKFWIGDILIPAELPEYIFTAVDGGMYSGEGLYRSTNDGEDWSKVFTTGTGCLAEDPSDPDVLYLGTTAYGYVYRSDDKGSNWEQISPGGEETSLGYWIYDLEADRHGKVYAATTRGLWSWQEGGDWSLAAAVPGPATAIAIDEHYMQPVIYAGTDANGIYCSMDGGLSWDSYSTGLESMRISTLAIAGTFPGYLLAGTTDAAVWKGTLAEGESTRMEEIHESGSFRIWPNPGNGSFLLTVEPGLRGPAKLKVISLQGKELLSIPDIPTGRDPVPLHLDHLGPGCYLIMLETGSTSHTEKIVIR